ncbi:hypothetical protein BVRB_030500 [Beta vulgaris subsp. vulgaris]|uniref:Uncharacterized protein n=1 Tax=Beta vulgaris subsp. vulgaris TaxID=3555 RepID=A0A0J8DS15_BETVV|nr:hypothetical protein BVRB_030500 [Beta vulgaris subsp. vulgaris]
MISTFALYGVWTAKQGVIEQWFYDESGAGYNALVRATVLLSKMCWTNEFGVFVVHPKG